MSLKLGNTPIAGISQNKICNAHFLFEPIWSDHIINDISLLRADTFSWQSGDVYTSAYNHLVADLQGITAETETIGSYTVTFYRATDGHKVALADQETTIANIYSETGIAWYYIVDTVNTQFKLPRTKYGFEGLRTNVGDLIDESLPNIKGTIQMMNTYGDVAQATGSFEYINPGTSSFIGTNSQTGKGTKFALDASRSSSTYQDNAPVQERATQMYLYFYVGDYSQTAIEQTAGLNAELFNGKADLNLANVNDQAKILMSGMAMPSDKYINLTLGASGSYYTAPANGYVRLTAKSNNASFAQVQLYGRVAMRCPVTATGAFIAAFIPVFKGESFAADYKNVNSTEFRFYYAQGSESEAS